MAQLNRRYAKQAEANVQQRNGVPLLDQQQLVATLLEQVEERHGSGTTEVHEPLCGRRVAYCRYPVHLQLIFLLAKRQKGRGEVRNDLGEVQRLEHAAAAPV